MKKDQILRELDRLRSEVSKPEPDLRDVMEKLEDIERRLDAIERQPIIVDRPVPYPVRPWRPAYPQPYYPMYGSTTAVSSTTSSLRLSSGKPDDEMGGAVVIH